MTLFNGNTTNPAIVLATSNQGKVREFSALLHGATCQIIPQHELGVESVEETGCTFIENAILKARHAAFATNLAAIADDSGLVVDALNGAPGIYSARYAGEQANSDDNTNKLLHAMKTVPDNARTAHFYCVIVWLQHAKDPAPVVCTGQWQGMISKEKKGIHGFGYDPVFYLPEFQCTAAELPAKTKNIISHRAQAMAKLTHLHSELTKNL